MRLNEKWKSNIKMSLKKIDKDMSYSSKWKTTILTFLLGTFVPPAQPPQEGLVKIL